ncbi:MAG: hypothetical protein ACYDBP_04425 [Leptospirales bacterium]
MNSIGLKFVKSGNGELSNIALEGPKDVSELKRHIALVFGEPGTAWTLSYRARTTGDSGEIVVWNKKTVHTKKTVLEFEADRTAPLDHPVLFSAAPGTEYEVDYAPSTVQRPKRAKEESEPGNEDQGGR